ncbi:hypothetical protein DOTSEDRAFT_91337 [Dothistroma septosporum NZE10]|uniref:AB hydrolase-1 domain-containing protein n=1 Tax=Dothistroma septosporum (strain NZE10 / CBS 128990) TaxID=675120 RepID=N1PD69_DOTSN|nr:hypothetical protein DOTSEDRAFT_91337 [Dothistroma septosporum NZE10]
MDKLNLKDFRCTRGFTYHYYISDGPSEDTRKPTFSALWQFIAPRFVELGYKVVVPDLLGYGGTSKPTDPEAYVWAEQARDLIEILDHEGVRKIVSIGHDWGSVIAQRVYHFFPERVVGIALLSVWYFPPLKDDKPLNLQAVNDYYEKVDGYRRIEYQTFFIEDDASKIWEEHLESAWTALHAEGPESMKRLFCVPGAFRNYLVSDKKDVALRPFAQNNALRDVWISDMKQGGLTAPFCWYKSRQLNVHGNSEKDLPEDRARVTVPVLYISGDEDKVCLGKDILPMKEAGLLPDLKIHELHSGHWLPYERPEEVTALLKDWLNNNGI